MNTAAAISIQCLLVRGSSEFSCVVLSVSCLQGVATAQTP